MFRLVSIAVLLAALVGIFSHFITITTGTKSTKFAISKQGWTLVSVIRTLVYLVAMLSFSVLLVTGFLPRLLLGRAIWGYLTMLHAIFSPVFVCCVAILAVMWAENSILDKNYLPWLNRLLARQPKNTAAPCKYEFAQKISFWLILILVLPLTISILLMMFPIFGPHGQEVLLQIHRYIALAVVFFGLLHTYLTILTYAVKKPIS